MRLFFVVVFCVIGGSMAFSQGTFQSNASGQWQYASTWTLVSGSDADGVPDANDDVTIQSGHSVSIANNQSCNDLIFNNGTLSYNQQRTLTINGDVDVLANSSINGYNNAHVFNALGDLDIPVGITFSVGAVSFTIGGTTTVNGALAISGYGAKPRNFGDVTINSGGSMTCTGQDAYTFNGDLINNGTFTATSYGTTFAFTSSSGIIGGSGLISLFSATFNSPANYTNQGNLQFRDSMSGTGSFTNGAGGELELQNSGPFSVATFDASATGNTITYSGYGSPAAFSGSYYNFVLNKSSGSVSFSGDISIENDLTIKSGIFQVGAITADIGGDLILEGGEFTPDNSSGQTNLSGDMIMSGGEYDQNNGDVNFSGDVILTGGDFSIAGGSSTLDIAGSFNHNTGSATVLLDAGTITVPNIYVASGNVFNVEDVNVNSSGTTELDGTMLIKATGGTKTYGDIQVNPSGTWSVTQNEGFTITGDIVNNGTFNGSPTYGSATYNLTSTSGTISGTGTVNIRNLLINSSASITNLGVLAIANSFNGSGTFVNGTGGELTYSGNNSSGSNFTISNFYASATGNTVIYSRAGDQRLRATSDAANNYYNLVIDMDGAGDDLTMVSNITVDNQLTLNVGDVFLGNYRLTLSDGATVSGGNTSSYIGLNGSGVLRQELSSTGASLSFPIGDNNDFSPVTAFALNSGTIGSNAYVEIDVTDSNHPNRNTDNTGVGGDDDGTSAVDYISRYWSFSAANISSPSYSVTAQYTDGDINGTEANMIGALYRQPIGESFNDWVEKGTVNPVTNEVTVTGADNWGDLYAMDNNMDRLPIDLVYFDAYSVGGSVELAWQTASEVDNELFIIERSINGVDFNPLLTVESKGNSSALTDYSTRDVDPINGRSFYRLKQVDFNGQFTYSSIKAVNFSGFNERHDLSVYPNPASAGGVLKIGVSNTLVSDYELRIYTNSGRLVFTESVQATTQVDHSVVLPNNIKPGIYHLVITNEVKSLKSRLLIH